MVKLTNPRMDVAGFDGKISRQNRRRAHFGSGRAVSADRKPDRAIHRRDDRLGDAHGRDEEQVRGGIGGGD